MKKLFLSIVIAIVAVTATFAQNNLVATLSHGDSIRIFYGGFALRDAFNAAESGDIINLSGGAFQAVNITKAVTLRGAGINADTPTLIIYDFQIEIPSNDTERLVMEGIKCTGTISMHGSFDNPYFVKCEFNKIWFGHYSLKASIKNASYVNCKIFDSVQSSGYDTSTKQFINCYLNWYDSNNGENCTSFINCIVRDADYVKNSQFINCIIYTNDLPKNKMHATSTATNCVGVKFTNFFEYSPSSSGCTTADFSDVFKTFKGGYFDNTENFELSDAAKKKYLGTDGTQVGIYGGVLPYDPIPSYPQITKMNVADRTTNDGKLSVEIEVSDGK